ncbi:DUF397 domain-containing protein [Actinomadura craniellae]|uniref:DUF397 domain-containing protein n=1 Tax=Actinomadura craniellae TaxID=2231787 RepID=A0A365H1Z3_9ACTN|nr:DUF397 domain-containing protein [Actinomadura craniellae]RAY13046.1 DUF397 domain-containing protein [Actinomadura craniellae]
MPTASRFADAQWCKSSHSPSQADCVEVAVVPGHVGVRDTKDRHGPVLSFSKTEWRVFLYAAKAGAHDG